MSATRRVLRLELSGLVAVHAARAVHTALGAVPGVVTAQVSLAGAELELVGTYDASRFADEVRSALDPIGIALVSVTELQDRLLPLLAE